MITISVIAIGIFSAFILYDINRIITGGETNYVTATLAIYLSVYNVFALLDPRASTGGSETKALRCITRPLRGLVLLCFSSRSKTAMLSTWAVCGNMLTTPAAMQR